MNLRRFPVDWIAAGLSLGLLALVLWPADAAPAEPFLVLGPAGEAFEACGADYALPPVKSIKFHCCPGTPRCDVFRSGFEP